MLTYIYRLVADYWIAEIRFVEEKTTIYWHAIFRLNKSRIAVSNDCSTGKKRKKIFFKIEFNIYAFIFY